MFGLFSRARRNVPVEQAPSARPTLERLENRDCPSTITLGIAHYAQNKMVTLYGQLTDTPSQGGQTIQLSGAVSGTTTTDLSGNFYTTLQASALDYVFASTADGLSNTAQVLLADQPPTWNYFNVCGYGMHMNYFYGNLSGSNLGGDIVTFSGLHSLQGVTRTLDSYGNFWLMLTLDGQNDDAGFAMAQVTDWYGQTSDVAMRFISDY